MAWVKYMQKNKSLGVVFLVGLAGCAMQPAPGETTAVVVNNLTQTVANQQTQINSMQSEMKRLSAVEVELELLKLRVQKAPKNTDFSHASGVQKQITEVGMVDTNTGPVIPQFQPMQSDIPSKGTAPEATANDTMQTGVVGNYVRAQFLTMPERTKPTTAPEAMATNANNQSHAQTMSNVSLQLATYKNMTTLKKGWTLLNKKFKTHFQGKQPLQQTIKYKGNDYWLLKVGPFATVSEATVLCEKLKQQQQECVINDMKGERL